MESPIALITGAAGGIGSQTAKMLDQRGYQLVLVDINQEGMDLLAATLQRPALCINANLLLLEDIERIYETTMEKFGQLDLLVNNAGMVVVGEYEERSHELVEREMNLNFMAAARLITLFLPDMKRRRSGQIITVSSLAGIVPIKESPVYTASKFALRGLMLSLQMSLKEFDIKVTNICPAAVDTPMLLHEAQNGGSMLNFFSDPQPPSAVVGAIAKAIDKDCIEICVPESDGILSKLAGSFPRLNAWLTPRLEKMARKNHRKYLQSKGLLDT